MNNKLINKPELLSPAGNLEKLKYAIKYGADAVYIGGRNYSLRANNDNFSIDDIKEACLFAHDNNTKVYVTVNIIFHDEDVIGLKDYLLDLNKCGVDAIIVSDPLILPLVKEVTSNMEIHLSTQQSTINYEAVKFWQKQGVKRIVLGREVSGNDIKEIIEKTGMDIEVFIHGAMCSGYSGNCVLSNYLTARDSNRGGCSQICRWNFKLLDSQNNLVDNNIDYAIAPKDLSMLKYIGDLIDLGVKSFKIEGRMRSVYYISTILHTYRRVIDEYCDDNNNYKYNPFYETLLYRCANRDAVSQYFIEKPGVNEQYYTGRDEVSNQDFLGIIIGYDKELKEAIIEQRNYFEVGTSVQVFGPKINNYNFVIKYIKDEDNNKIDAARHPKEILRIPINIEVSKDDILRVRID